MIKTALTNDAFEQAIIQGDFNMYTQASKAAKRSYTKCQVLTD